jgi:fucose 4-O-acetylase-like acetyltransferase
MMPATRERHVDLIRATAIWAVVMGHWLVIAVTQVDGSIDGVNALRALGWAHPLTWAFQVMPLFFFVGGYANATSMARHRRAGGDALGWVVRRFRRLLGPSVTLLAVIVAAVTMARVGGVDDHDAARAAWLATVPLWFLTAYLATIALSPVAHAAHRRWGLTVPLASAGAIALIDLIRFHVADAWMPNLNYLLVWFTIHQLGFAWHDGRMPARPRVGAAVAAVGLVALIGLTVLGPYPISMVRVPGSGLHNSEPPTVALLALAIAQIGLVLAVRDRAARWLQRARPWGVVSRIQRVVLTLFLWHMAAAAIAAVALYGTGMVPLVPIGSGEWLAWRIPWVATCLVVLAGLVAVFGRVERAWAGGAHDLRAGPGSAALAGVGGVLATLVGMLGIAVAGSGVHGPLALPTWSLVVIGLGFCLILLVPTLGTSRSGGHR